MSGLGGAAAVAGKQDLVAATQRIDAGLGRLKADLDSGDWQGRYADVTGLEEYDAGYRLLVAGPRGDPPDC